MVLLHYSGTLQLQMIELKMLVLQLHIISISMSHVLLVADSSSTEIKMTLLPPALVGPFEMDRLDDTK